MNNGNVIAEYVYFGLRPVAVKNGSNINIVHTDYLTTPRIVTSGGSIVWQWRNDNPYGNNLAQGNVEFNLRFAGQYYDAESGLHYNIHRTYNPEIGRYMQSDPLGLSAGSNTYNYVNRNPFDAVDPLGLEGISGTENKIISGAINNPMSVPIGSYGISMHSITYLLNNNISVQIESNSELYRLAKLKNPFSKTLKENKDLNLSAQALADLLNKTLDLNKYDSIYLMSCNLGNDNYIDQYSKKNFAQTLSNILNKKIFAYTEYIVAEEVGGINDYYSGYYTNPIAFRAKFLGFDTFVKSRNAEKIKREFNPEKK